jgi:hypothetical protein
MKRAGGLGRVGVAQTRLRRKAILADQPTEQITTADAIKVDDVADSPLAQLKLAARRPLLEGPVRPVLVVMQDVGGEDVVEVAAAKDEEPVEALAGRARVAVLRRHPSAFARPVPVSCRFRDDALKRAFGHGVIERLAVPERRDELDVRTFNVQRLEQRAPI